MSRPQATGWGWPAAAADLVSLQLRLAAVSTSGAGHPWRVPQEPVVAGCFVAFARGEAGPGRPGDRAWAAAVAWRASTTLRAARRSDAALRGVVQGTTPRQAADVDAQAIARGRVAAAYSPGLLALREGPILEAALRALSVRPDVVLVDATGADHPRRAGLAIHLGAVLGIPTVGATHRPLAGDGSLPELVRGATAPVRIGDEIVGRWVCTRTGARPVLAHRGWLTDDDAAVAVVLASSTEAARTPVPLQEARRVAREARALAGAGEAQQVIPGDPGCERPAPHARG